MCPIVPTFTCGFDRSNFCLAIRRASSVLLPTGLREGVSHPRFRASPQEPVTGCAGDRTTSTSRRRLNENWSPCPGLNRRPRPYQGRALPTELHGPDRQPLCPLAKRARTNRWSGKRDSNPRPPAWKAGALPLSYSRVPYPASSRRSGRWWGEEDLNPRRRPPADLQSAPFGHLGISPLAPPSCNLVTP